MACIEARGLRKAYGTTVALDGLDLRVEEGRILGLIGPNGAGKTTALNAILGLTPFQGDHKAPPHSYWRLIEMGSCYPGGYPWYGAGCVNGQGRLVGLPNQFRSGYPYNGYMQLQIGCLGENDEHQITPHIDWPGTCQKLSPVYAC